MNFNQLFNIINIVLAQTPRQKEQTIVAVGLLALGASLFIMDNFAKNSFGAGKVLKKILLFFSVIAIFAIIAMLIFYR